MMIVTRQKFEDKFVTKSDTISKEKLARQQSAEHKKTGYMGLDSRAGRLKTAKTDRGEFRFKDNKKE